MPHKRNGREARERRRKAAEERLNASKEIPPEEKLLKTIFEKTNGNVNEHGTPLNA